jgi:hypothetical protein
MPSDLSNRVKPPFSLFGFISFAPFAMSLDPILLFP